MRGLNLANGYAWGAIGRVAVALALAMHGLGWATGRLARSALSLSTDFFTRGQHGR